MYLSNIKLWNFRKFGSEDDFDIASPNLNLNFSKGLNALIGENDSGKTAIIDAIKLVIKTHSYDWIKITDEDFYGNSKRLRIEITLEDLQSNEAKNFTEWLSIRGDGDDAEPYLKLNYDVKRNDDRILPSDVKAGPDDDGYQMSAEAKEYLKATYLKPLRDAKSELIPRKNSRLSQIFKGHEAFKDKDENHHLVNIFRDFNVSIEKYFEALKISIADDGTQSFVDLEDVNGKLLKNKIDEYIKSFYDINKETQLSVVEGNLKNILEKLELSIKDEINPGLGSLNRLFMASELLHLNKVDWDGLRLGLIEELEAHLHPQAQMQMIESLKNQENIQLILTTHSPNLASKLSLESLVIVNKVNAYPMGKRIYTELDDSDYVFLERFLDTTKANLFFAKGVLMVEGWSEEILIPSLVERLKYSGVIKKNLTESGVSIVNVGNTAFLRYSNIFLRKKIPNMEIPVSIVTDVDVRTYEKVKLVSEGGEIINDYIPIDEGKVEQESSDKVAVLDAKFSKDNVKAFVAPCWTLEYSIYKSNSLGELFKAIVKLVHPRIDMEQFEKELSKKLINKTLNKTEISYILAQELDDDIKYGPPIISIDENEPALKYLLDAIKYVVNN
ncbi:MAG: AAA family ATPase [Pseudomonadota bacterium]